MATRSRRTPSTSAPSLELDRVDAPHPAYSRMAPRWAKCRALMGGTDDVRDLDEDALPRLVGESDEAYAFRQKLCAVFNGYKRTVKACTGLLLEKNPTLGDDMSAMLKDVWEDVDRAGTHGDVYTRRITQDALTDGHAGTLVDYPRVADPERVSWDDERRQGLRPFWVKYTAEQIVKAAWAKVGGIKVLVLLVLKEESEERVGRFGVGTVTRYRVFLREGDTITWELWRAQDGGMPIRELGPLPLRGVTRIPFSFLIAGDRVERSDFETRPPLEDLADLNLEHHRTKTDIRNLQSLACVPTQVRIGATPDDDGNYPEITLGPRSTIEAPHIEGVTKPVYWHTPDVAVLDPAMRSLEEIKAEMGAAGLAFLAPDKRAAETAEAKRLDASAQNASLSTVSRAVQDHLEEVFGITAEYLGDRGGSVTLNRDFEKLTLDPAMITALTKAAEIGKLSIETFLALLERFRVLPEGFDVEAEVKRILAEGARHDAALEDEDEPPAGDEDAGGEA